MGILPAAGALGLLVGGVGGGGALGDAEEQEELAGAFEASGLEKYIWKGKPDPQWPTLRELIESGTRVVVFIESGRKGVDWIRPAFENIRETPYHFSKQEEFSCRANRGGDGKSLFLMNHWIDTTPTPRPMRTQNRIMGNIQ